MRLRVGVDVGGTFTKAVAVDPATGAVRHVRTVPTTHDAPGGVADGVVTVLAALADAVGAAALGAVTWSTTQAVNALLEGDVATVGVLGLGSRPDLGKARRRTRLHDVELVAGRRLPVVGEFLDVTDGLDPQDLAAALDRLQGAGAGAVAVAEAFAPDRGAAERAAVRAATARGLPACGSTDLVGMYGLELRTVTAAVNAAILPVATATADTVQRGAHAAGLPGPLLVMRGDGGATDLAGFRQEPARSLYSGPAASVAGVLRALAPLEAVVVEGGGTS
ncbi:MAG: hydantoinase/oxoprolinase N-terminal domain-containing protein, partial [Actinomycetota bacterium]